MRRRRVVVFSAVLLLSIATLTGLMLAHDGDPTQGADDGTDTSNASWHTLITVQAYGWFDNHNGDVFVVDREGNRVWTYQPENANVFDGEVLDNGNVLVSYGQEVPDSECPAELRDTPQDHCIKNHVREVDRNSKAVVWEYTWWDRFVAHHEVHDADRLPSGETVIIDMGHHRTFTVDREREVTWEWSAIEYLDEGSEFWAQHVTGTSREDHAYTGPNQDWTHMNDVDALPNGNYLVSIRNFDVLVEVDPTSDEIVRVFGEPGNHSIINEQHDPHYLPESDNVVVADSENDRIVEYDFETSERVWEYQGPGTDDRLAWPRDADRLPDGNTLIADSRNFRALEVNESGAVVWSYSLQDERGIVYDVDRIGPNRSYDEEPTNATSGAELSGTSYQFGVIGTIDSWLGFVLPPWVGVWGLVALVVGLGAVAGLGWEAVRARRAETDDTVS